MGCGSGPKIIGYMEKKVDPVVAQKDFQAAMMHAAEGYGSNSTQIMGLTHFTIGHKDTSIPYLVKAIKAAVPKEEQAARFDAVAGFIASTGTYAADHEYAKLLLDNRANPERLRDLTDPKKLERLKETLEAKHANAAAEMRRTVASAFGISRTSV